MNKTAAERNTLTMIAVITVIIVLIIIVWLTLRDTLGGFAG